MSRLYMFTVGLALLLGLYFELPWVVYALVGLMFFEGVTDRLAAKLVHRTAIDVPRNATAPPRFNFAAERAWHVVVATVLAVSYIVFRDQLWFFPWFVGFAVMGAGLSGVCPVLIFLKLAGFR